MILEGKWEDDNKIETAKIKDTSLKYNINCVH